MRMKPKVKKRLIKQKGSKNVPFGLKISGNVISSKETDSITTIAKLLTKRNIGVVVIKSNGRLAGILSERDIVQRVVARHRTPETTLARHVMTKKVVTVNLDQGLDKVYHKMKHIKFRHLPVVSGNEVIGIVSNRDLMYLRKLKFQVEKEYK